MPQASRFEGWIYLPGGSQSLPKGASPVDSLIDPFDAPLQPCRRRVIRLERKTMRAYAIAVAAALLVTTAPAAAQSASDATCILVSNAFAKAAKDPKQQQVAQATSYFYLGRIGDAMTAPRLKTLFDTQAKTITEANAGNLMNACVKAIETKVQMLQSLSPEKPPQGR